MNPILEQFLSEARDNLSYLDQHLPELKDKDEEVVNALFRAAHTLKGGAGLVGFSAVQEITHKAEDLLDAFRNNKIEYSDEMLDALYDAVDEVVELVDAAEEKGDVDLDVDKEKIEEIKNNILKLLDKNTEQTQTQENEIIDTQLNLSEFYAGELIDFNQISNIDIPIRTPKITNNLLENDNYWLIDMDLDEDTIKLGNDPYYILYLIGEENILYISSSVNCKELQDDPYLWKTRIVAVVKSNKEAMEDAFYNIIDEITVAPLSIENLLKTTYESLESDVYADFKDELHDAIKNGNIIQKIQTITEVISKETKEGYILNLLKDILEKYPQDSQEYNQILQMALDELEIEIENIETQEESNEKTLNNNENISKQEIEAAKNILESQIKALSFFKEEDKSFIERTKLVLNNVSKSLNIDCKTLDSASTKEEIKDVIDKIISKIAELESAVDKKDTQDSQPKEEKQQKDTVGKQSTKLEHKKTESSAAHMPKTVKIDQSTIDELMDIVGELLVMKNALPYIANKIGTISEEQSKREIFNKYEEISRLTDQLQDKVMGMRLLPLSYIFGRYPKLVRELSKKLNKKIKYIEEGSETKLDKMMIEKLADPLIHIIRNSIDHGIETVEERKAKGKNEEGVLKVAAHSKGDRVFIEISDDGAGINTQKLISKVLEKGMIEPDKLDAMSEEEKLQLIFLPGLSTKDEVSELSGRGVGGDAVKRVVDELGGKIHIKSSINQGTTIVLELPVSVALTNVFHVKLNNINYAISMEYMVETVKIDKRKIKTANHKPFIRIRGELIPLIFEKSLLGTGYENKDEYSILVIQGKTSKYGFVVDEFIGQLDVVQKPLNGVLENHPLINGTSLLGNGDVLFILDPSSIVKE